MHYKHAVIAASLLSLLTACGQEKTPAFVSPLEFKAYNCNQIAKEMIYVSGQLNQVDNNAQLNSVLSAGVAAFAVSQGHVVAQGQPGDEKSEYLRARYAALHQASIQKNCD